MKPPDRYTCEDMFRKLDDYLDRALTPEEMEKVRRHLELCATCASEYRFEESLLSELRKKVRRISDSPAPADLMARISSLIAKE
jgi:anti-sigma factor (TIGR02949 family)